MASIPAYGTEKDTKPRDERTQLCLYASCLVLAMSPLVADEGVEGARGNNGRHRHHSAGCPSRKRQLARDVELLCKHEDSNEQHEQR